MQTNTLSKQQQHSFQALAQQAENLNTAMRQAVEAGLSIELQRLSRHHRNGGYWGDILMPMIVKQE
jgi:hypothetical protein